MKFLLVALVVCVAVCCGVEAIKCYNCHRCPIVNDKTPTVECKGDCVLFHTKENDGTLYLHRHCEEEIQSGDKDGCDAIKRETDKPVVDCAACKTDLCNKQSK